MSAAVHGLVNGLLAGLLAGCGAAPPAPPAPPERLCLMTLNVANGAADRYRTPMARAAQRALVAAPQVVGLQEVDIGVTRTDDVNTALALAGPAFDGCSFEVAQAPHVSPEGALRCDAAAGTVLFGVALRGSDAAGMPLGITDGDESLNPKSVDRGSDALYGNALIVRGVQVEFVAVVALPGAQMAPVPGEYAALVEAPAARRAAHNLALRSTPGLEARSVLLARLLRPGAATLSVLDVHLSSGPVDALRLAQLGAVLELAQAERAAGRQPVVLGDFNLSVEQAAPALLDAGFRSAAQVALDQLWVDSALTLRNAATVPGGEATDHDFAVSACVE